MTKKTKNTCVWAINIATDYFNKRIETLQLEKELDYLKPNEADNMIKDYQSWIEDMTEAYKEIKGIDL